MSLAPGETGRIVALPNFPDGTRAEGDLGEVAGDDGGVMNPDVMRLRQELETLWTAIQQDLEEEEPDKPPGERRQLARSRFVTIVDDAVREIANG